ncbi:hypothetical protein BC830DRAFT_1113820 [Chytriomyces sp. MP71]|nr:hypothetical protein BC830DRAFT_1113820 [Chytriomyces sp. MP71]
MGVLVPRVQMVKINADDITCHGRNPPLKVGPNKIPKCSSSHQPHDGKKNYTRETMPPQATRRKTVRLSRHRVPDKSRKGDAEVPGDIELFFLEIDALFAAEVGRAERRRASAQIVEDMRRQLAREAVEALCMASQTEDAEIAEEARDGRDLRARNLTALERPTDSIRQMESMEWLVTGDHLNADSIQSCPWVVGQSNFDRPISLQSNENATSDSPAFQQASVTQLLRHSVTDNYIDLAQEQQHPWCLTQ